MAEEKDILQDENATEEKPAEETSTESAESNFVDTEQKVAAEKADKENEKEEKKDKKKKDKSDKKQEVLKERIEELEDRVKRQMAEFDNFRKRTEKEKTAMFETGAKSVIEKRQPVVDNFERGLATVPEEEKGGAFAQGMEMIYKQLMTELENIS